MRWSVGRAAGLLRRWGSETGASLVEYALVVALIGVVSIAAITLVGENTSTRMDCTAQELGAPPPTQLVWRVEVDQTGAVRDVQVAEPIDICS